MGLIIAAIWAVAPLAVAQPLDPDRFEEYLNPKVEVSGTTRAGILLDAMATATALETLSVRIPENFTHDRLCLNLVTRDGRYEAIMEFSVPSGAEGLIELTFPSRYKRQLLEPEKPFLSVLAGLRKDCEDDETIYLPAGFSLSESLTKLDVVVNVGDLDAHLAIPTRGGSKRRIECERIEISPTVAFNRICTVELDAALNLMDTVIHRDDFFGNPLPPIALPIAI